jgi:DNA helicase-2/ATP-dependent DNA helicase PcrA
LTQQIAPLPQSSPDDAEMTGIVAEEQRCLDRVEVCLAQRAQHKVERREVDYDSQLLELRDEIATARLEDVPPLLEQMERLQVQAAAARQRQQEQTDEHIDPRSPYFGRMVLRESGREREILVGRSTYLDSKSNLRIVDWRDAPVSRLYYRYAEGDEYEEVFGEREVLGEVVTRRSLTIVERRLRRIISPQGTFLRPEKGDWQRGGGALKLHGGQGSAIRPEQHHKPGKLGIGALEGGGGDIREDKHLREITALIDPRQFELLTKPDSGLVVIQGGAGSGKTTIGLHRLAYLAYQDKRRFRPDRMVVIVFNTALARYISQVLPALDVHGVAVRTYEDFAARLRTSHFAHLPKTYATDTPTQVTRLKKHPLILQALDRYVDQLAQRFAKSFLQVTTDDAQRQLIAHAWEKTAGRPLTHRVYAVARWTQEGPRGLSSQERHKLERAANDALELARDVTVAWAEILTDVGFLRPLCEEHAPGAFTDRDLERISEWCNPRCSRVLQHLEEIEQAERDGLERSDEKSHGKAAARPHRDRDDADRDGGEDDEDDEPLRAADGGEVEEAAELDREDDTLLLALYQRLRGPLMRPSMKEALIYEHALIDEAQDLSPIELSVILGTMSKAQSVTLAGDVAQRLYMNNGFTSWQGVLSELGLSHVAIEPLKLSYRSTAEILDFSRAVLGPLADPEPPEATRGGVPVDLFRFGDSGDAVGFLAEALRELVQTEPRSSVAVIARYPEHADLYYEGLKKAEVPYLRRIADQDFPFKPGIDVTDVRQVKGLEFDYVVLVEVTESTYGEDDEARHLLHIAATRCSHQLWVVASGTPSRLLPAELRDRGY